MKQSPYIFYYCPCTHDAVGGNKVIYQHVEVLHKNGLNAAVLHSKPGFSCTWFEHQTPIAYFNNSFFNRFIHSPPWPKTIRLPNGENKVLTNDDIVVVPETYGTHFQRFAPGHKKVIFNQSAYHTFTNYSMDLGDLRGHYLKDDIIACLTISEDTTKNLEFAFPSLPIYRVYLSINSNLFYFSENKKPIITYMPRKNPDHARHVINLLKFHATYQNIDIQAIQNKSESEVASLLRKSLIFMSVGFPEGFALPPAEAMACGCLVVGYHGNGAKEYMKPELCYPFEIWDTLGMAKTLDTILSNYKTNPAPFQEKGRRASGFIGSQYSKEKEEQCLLDAWGKILQSQSTS